MSSINKPKTEAELKKFGFVMALAFTLLAGVLFWRHGWAAPYVAMLPVFFLPAAVFAPNSLRAVEHYWMLFGEKMSIVMTFLILTVMYYVLITPLGVILRLMGKDLLSLKLEPTASTYWEKTDPSGSGSRFTVPY